MTRFAVIGAGLAGLTAALRLRQADPNAQICLWEGSDRIGGKLHTRQIDRYQLDVGAESILARRPEGLDLIHEIGLSDRLVHPNTTSAAIWTHGKLRPIPPTVQGIPADLHALSESGIISDPIESRPAALPDNDVSIAEFVSERIGANVVERLVEPMLGGVYAGRANQLSLYAAAPQIAGLAPDLLAAAAQQHKHRVSAEHWPVFAGLRGGVGQLPAAIAALTGADIRTRATVRATEAVTEGYRLTISTDRTVEHQHVDAVVVATPAVAASRLLAEITPRASVALAGIDYASMAIITLVLDSSVPVEGSGFLVPAVDGRNIKAATISSRKWPWVGDSGGTIIRASIGRMGDSHQLRLRDDALARMAVDDLSEAFGQPLMPRAVDVQRWGGALPQYDVGHLSRVNEIEADVQRLPGLAVCGAAYRGLGIPAVIANASTAVSGLLARLG